MDFFSFSQYHFDQANFEYKALSANVKEAAYISGPIIDPNQFILFQISDGEDKRLLTTSEVLPTLKGDDIAPDVNLQIDFDAFKVSSQEDIDASTKATLQLIVGQEEELGPLDKLFYCINGGLNLFDNIKGDKASPESFKQSTNAAMGKKAIAMPGGVGQIALKVLKHQEPAWWQQVFSFLNSRSGQELMSLVGFGGITASAVQTINGMINQLFPNKPEVLFESAPIRVAFSQRGRDSLSGGLNSNLVSCLNPGFWIMARLADYKDILDAKPIYYGGYGMLAPDGMDLPVALSTENPFFNITYAILRVRMKATDLKQNFL